MKNKLERKVYSSAIKSTVRAAAVLLALGIASAPSVLAHPKSKKAASSNLGVIAHVQLDGGSAARLLLVKKDGKRYLYAGLSSSTGVCILDVTMPAAPRKVERLAGTGGAQADFQLVGDTLAVSSRSGDETLSASGPAPRSVTILNMVDPANPQPIQTFSGVTSIVTDDARGLIYLSNGEGLWIVQTKQPEKPEPVDQYGG
jgi:hypothetical protein